jgi:hypothetical protein
MIARDFKNCIVKEQYDKFIKNVTTDSANAYMAWLNTLEVFDSYVDEVKRVLEIHAPVKILD